MRHRGLVFDHQNSLRAAPGQRLPHHPHAGSESRLCRTFPRKLHRRSRERGQLHSQLGALAGRTLDAHFAAVFLHDSIHDRKPKAGAHTRRLCREERIKDAGDNLVWNARSVVGDFECDPVTRQAPRPNRDGPPPRPCWMACSALTIRLNTTCWSWAASASVGGRSGAGSRSTWMFSIFNSYERRASVRSTTSLRSTARRSGLVSRANSRRFFTIRPARSASSEIR